MCFQTSSKLFTAEDTYRNIGAHTSKPGIVQRNPQVNEAAEQTFSLKITLKECDLILLELPESPNSLALVAHTTAVLNMNDARKLLNANLEIQVNYLHLPGFLDTLTEQLCMGIPFIAILTLRVILSNLFSTTDRLH